MANQKQSDLFWGGGAGAIAVPKLNEPVSFTPTIVGFGTVNTVDIFYQRVGKKLEVYGSFFAPSLDGSAPYSISLPTGLNIDYTKLTTETNRQRIGEWSTFTVASQSLSGNKGDLYADGSTSDRVFTSRTVESGDYTNTHTGTGNTPITFKFSVPIAEWPVDELVGNVVEATSSAIGLVKKNKVQTKVLAANVTATQADMAIGGNTDFEFNGIINGQLYKIDLSVRILHSGSANVESIDVKAQYDGEIVRSYSRNDGGSTYVSASGFIGQQTSDSVYFIGTATTRLHFSSSVTGTGTIFSSATKATLTEVADSELTTDFT